MGTRRPTTFTTRAPSATYCDWPSTRPLNQISGIGSTEIMHTRKKKQIYIYIYIYICIYIYIYTHWFVIMQMASSMQTTTRILIRQIVNQFQQYMHTMRDLFDLRGCKSHNHLAEIFRWISTFTPAPVDTIIQTRNLRVQGGWHCYLQTQSRAYHRRGAHSHNDI